MLAKNAGHARVRLYAPPNLRRYCVLAWVPRLAAMIAEHLALVCLGARIAQHIVDNI